MTMTLEQQVKAKTSLGMGSGEVLRITLHYGFELGGAYETWSHEWRIEDPLRADYRWGRKGTFPLRVSGSSLDAAFIEYLHALEVSETAKREKEHT